MKRYKNKDIRSKYSVEYWFMVTGMVVSILCILLIVYGLFATVRVMKARCPFEEVLEKGGRHAGHVVTFEIVEEPVWVGKATRADYYLVTDGNRYIISEMKKSRYKKIRDEVKSSGKYVLDGMTLIIADDDERREVAENVSKELGEDINIYNFDDEDIPNSDVAAAYNSVIVYEVGHIGDVKQEYLDQDIHMRTTPDIDKD